AVIANFIGTTGASMLLIRPFIRLNRERIQPYHIVFFIFIVSNVGGCLTPVGDPPLFLGFLKGVPFFWTVEHLWGKWLLGVGALLVIFYFFDRKNYSGAFKVNLFSGKVTLYGTHNLLWLAIIIGSVFLDPGIIPWLPHISYHGDKISFVREAVMLSVAFFAYRTADKVCLEGNGFNFEPIKEVAFLFAGIFATMMPALQLISLFAQNHAGDVSQHTLYWASGFLSSVLDNAPTYLNFLSAGLGKVGLDISNKADVMKFAGSAETMEVLMAVSVASVFFGACTYIGNAPNFMVKSIAEQAGIKMPSFAGYVLRYTVPFLLPVLALIWLVFFVIL
ncbi:MAG TPA: sodium:proton antiporter, partial [Chitinophagales bacterium]|nr:sodium:proton antiporter [Chitinophagales bacterium]